MSASIPFLLCKVTLNHPDSSAHEALPICTAVGEQSPNSAFVIQFHHVNQAS